MSEPRTADDLATKELAEVVVALSMVISLLNIPRPGPSAGAVRSTANSDRLRFGLAGMRWQALKSSSTCCPDGRLLISNLLLASTGICLLEDG